MADYGRDTLDGNCQGAAKYSGVKDARTRVWCPTCSGWFAGHDEHATLEGEAADAAYTKWRR